MHFSELRAAYTFATKCSTALSAGDVIDFLDTAQYYIGQCALDTSSAWKECQDAFHAFAHKALERAPSHQRAAAASMGPRRVLEAACVVMGA